MPTSNNYTPQVPGPGPSYKPQQPKDSVLDTFLKDASPTSNTPNDPFEDLRQGYEKPKAKGSLVRRKIGAAALGVVVTVASIGAAIGIGNRGEKASITLDNPAEEKVVPVSSLQPDITPSTTINTQLPGDQLPGEPIILQPTRIGNVEFNADGSILQEVNWAAWVQGDKYLTEMLDNNEMSAEMASSNIRIIIKNEQDFFIGTAGLLELENGDVGLLTAQHVTDVTEGNYTGGMYAFIPGIGTINLSSQIGHIDRTDLTERTGSASELEDGDAAVVVHLSAEQQEIIRSLVEKGDLKTFEISSSPSQTGDHLIIYNGITGDNIKLVQVGIAQDKNDKGYNRDGQPELVVDNVITHDALKDDEFGDSGQAESSGSLMSLSVQDKEKLQESSDALVCQGMSGSSLMNGADEVVGVLSGGQELIDSGIGVFSFKLLDGSTCMVKITGSNL